MSASKTPMGFDQALGKESPFLKESPRLQVAVKLAKDVHPPSFDITTPGNWDSPWHQLPVRNKQAMLHKYVDFQTGNLDPSDPTLQAVLIQGWLKIHMNAEGQPWHTFFPRARHMFSRPLCDTLEELKQLDPAQDPPNNEVKMEVEGES